MDSFIYSVNATLPIFLVMVLGWYLMHRKMLNENFIQIGNKLMFNVALPISLYRSVASTDFSVFADGGLVAYCVIGTTWGFVFSWLVAVLFVKDQSCRGSFVQGSARGNIAILGFAFIQNMYDGQVGAMPLVLTISVTVQNLVSVIVLSFYNNESEHQSKKEMLHNTLIGIAKNPLLHGLLLGIISSGIGFTMPEILDKSLSTMADMATPLALIVLGAGFDFSKAKQRLGLTLGASAIKLLGLPAIMLPIAIFLGYRGITLASLLLMSGSSSAVTGYVMARSMHNDEMLASNVVAVTTLFASFTLTFWIFLLRTQGLI